MTNNTFGFNKALEIIKAGGKVSRDRSLNWFIFLVQGSTFQVNRAPLNTILPAGTEVNYRAHIDIMYDGNKVAVWYPNVTELLAEDWFEV